MSFFNIMNKFGYGSSLLVGISIFLSEKLENNVALPLIAMLFAIQMLLKINRENFFKLLDKKIGLGIIIFSVLPVIISIIDGGIKSRGDNYNLKYLYFFPLIYFLDNYKKIINFLKSLLLSAIISMIVTVGIFIKNYETWAHPKGFEYPRIYFVLPVQDFANLMCIVFLFLLSFIFFYKNNNKKKLLYVRIFLIAISLLNLFVLLVNRSKMVYVSLIPAILYILYKKNKKYILTFLFLCTSGYFILPKLITERLKYIIFFKKDPSSNLRLIFWDAGFHAFLRSPLLGWRNMDRKSFNLDYYKKTGVLDYVTKNYGFTLLKSYINSHNAYLQFLLDYGILGFLSFMFLFVIIIPVKLFKMSFYSLENESKYFPIEVSLKSVFIVWFIQGMTEINLSNRPIVIFTVIFLAIVNYLYKVWSNRKEEEK